MVVMLATCCMMCWGTLHVARCAVHVVCCPLHIARCMPHVVWLSSVARGVSSGAFSPAHVPRRMLSVVYYTVSSGLARCPLRVVCGIAVRRIGSAARSPSSVLCLHVLHCMRSVVCCLFPVACPSVAWRALSVACPTSHLVSRRKRGTTLHVVRCESSVACCMLHLPCRMLSLPVHSCMPSVASCTVDSQRRRARSASLRTHGDSQSHTVTLATCTHPHLGLQQVSPATEAFNCERRRGYSRARG
jgi:hypothetical protein